MGAWANGKNETGTTRLILDFSLRICCPQPKMKLAQTRPGRFPDCNDLKEVPLAEFNARFVAKLIRYFDKDLPASLRRALRKAIHASIVLSDEQKAIVAKP